MFDSVIQCKYFFTPTAKWPYFLLHNVTKNPAQPFFLLLSLDSICFLELTAYPQATFVPRSEKKSQTLQGGLLASSFEAFLTTPFLLRLSIYFPFPQRTPTVLGVDPDSRSVAFGFDEPRHELDFKIHCPAFQTRSWILPRQWGSFIGTFHVSRGFWWFGWLALCMLVQRKHNCTWLAERARGKSYIMPRKEAVLICANNSRAKVQFSWSILLYAIRL